MQLPQSFLIKHLSHYSTKFGVEKRHLLSAMSLTRLVNRDFSYKHNKHLLRDLSIHSHPFIILSSFIGIHLYVWKFYQVYTYDVHVYPVYFIAENPMCIQNESERNFFHHFVFNSYILFLNLEIDTFKMRVKGTFFTILSSIATFYSSVWRLPNSIQCTNAKWIFWV